MKHTALWLVVIAATLVSIVTPSSFAQDGTPLRLPAHYKVFPLKGVSSTALEEQIDRASSSSLPMWSYSITSPVDGNLYDGMIVGRSPFFHGHRTTAIANFVIPVKVTFSGGLAFDPTAPMPPASTRRRRQRFPWSRSRRYFSRRTAITS